LLAGTALGYQIIYNWHTRYADPVMQGWYESERSFHLFVCLRFLLVAHIAIYLPLVSCVMFWGCWRGARNARGVRLFYLGVVAVSAAPIAAFLLFPSVRSFISERLFGIGL
jgi:hypothetical protein